MPPARAATEREAPIRDLSSCIEALHKLRLTRELGSIEAEIVRLQRSEPSSVRLIELGMRKIELARLLSAQDRRGRSI